MEENKNKPVLIVILVMCCLASGVLGGYMGWKLGSKDGEAPDGKITEKSVSKIDPSKDYVYDADYKKNVDALSYESDLNKTFYAKDIVVPYINVKSNYAEKSNASIKTVFNSAIDVYNMGVKDKMVYVDECNYTLYRNDDILSIELIFSHGGSDIEIKEYYTYNINLENGNEFTFEEAYKKAGYTEESISNIIEDKITKELESALSEFKSNEYPEGEDFDTYNKKSIAKFRNKIGNGDLQYFLSDNNELNVVVWFEIPAQGGGYNTILSL